MLYMNIIYIAPKLFGGDSEILHYSNVFSGRQKLRLFGGDSEILHYSNVFAGRQKLFKLVIIFKQTHVNIFYHKNMTFLNYVTATLRALFA